MILLHKVCDFIATTVLSTAQFHHVNVLLAQTVKINHNGTNGLVVESDGTVRYDGSATVFEDMMVYPDATGKGGSKAPVWGGVSATAFKKNGGSQGVFLWMFSASTEQEVYFCLQLPHSYKVGTPLYPHVHWTTVTGTPNNSSSKVVWGLEYALAPIGGTYPASTSIITNNQIIPSITPSGTSQHLITSFDTIPRTGLNISTILVMRLYRAAASSEDTFGNEAGFLGFDIHYEKDTDGSRTEFTK